jgi:anti-sigma factor RsiW
MNVENEFASRACAEYEAFLEDYLDGALDNGTSRKVAEHLKSCAGCSLAFADAAAANTWLHQSERASDPGPAFSRIVMARIRAEEESRQATGFWEPFISLAWKFATTAALALVVMLAYAAHGPSAVRGNVVNTTAAAAPQGEVQEMLMADQPSGVPATRSELVRMVTESDTDASH